ncbi:MAG: carboxy terminal-processing peptidase, partial [Planctomycetaceae bacterium]|nr:carboxy terminal-processing peptidase [Planctomycetaceae bacterium]
HDQFNRVPPDLVAKLETRSWDRRKANPKFQKQDDRIKKYAERKARHSISLNEAKFRAEFVPDDEADPEHEKKLKDKDKPRKKFTEHPAWESDYYNDEVIKIVDDYLTLDPNVLLVKPIRVTADRDRITQ